MSTRLRSYLQQYRGLLTPPQVAAGVTAARRNAHRLAEDAELMLENARWSSAVTLAVLAIEEAGKVSILRALALAQNEEEAKSRWKQFRSHGHKNAGWIFATLVSEGASILDDFAPMFQGDSDHSAILEGVKQVATYADCYGAVRWSTPEDITFEELARSLCTIARLDAGTSPRVCTEREVELWIEHLGPVWMTTMEHMKLGLVALQQAMLAEGLSDTDPDFFASFLNVRPAK